MLRKILIGFAVVLSIVVIALGLGVYYFKPSPERILTHLLEKEEAAIHWQFEGKVLASKNAHRPMPLASTVKLVIAVNYAQQCAAGKLNPDALVSLDTLALYYVPDTDGGAHVAWLESLGSQAKSGKVRLEQVAKGMIDFSSNANTEYLLELLGLDAINASLAQLGLNQHTPIYYLVSALFVGKEAFPGAKGDSLVQLLNNLPLADYRAYTLQIHEKLKSDTAYKRNLGDMSLDVQRIWSDRLPAGTAASYAGLLQKINRGNFFDTSTRKHLKAVLEEIMKDPHNAEWLQHAGMKGGSTAFVLTQALYATDTAGSTTELAYFFNDLDPLLQVRLELSMNDFELALLSDAAFRKKVAAAFSSQAKP